MVSTTNTSTPIALAKTAATAATAKTAQRGQRRWRKRALYAGAAVIVAGVAVFLFVRARTAPVQVAWETAAVDRGTITAKVTATGTLSALVTVQVGSQVSGRVQQLFADFNSEVHKGQVIAKLDPQLYEAALEQAKANTQAAESNLTKAKAQAADAARTHDRTRALFAKQLLAQADLDSAATAVDVANAGVGAAASAVEQTRAALHQAQVNLAYTTITSPIEGIVVSRNVDVGQTVAAAFQSPTLFVLAEDLKKMQVDTSVSEADVGRLRAGVPASFHVDAYPKKEFVGSVRQIRNAPQTVQNVVTYDAVIDVRNEALELRPGMTANVAFVVDRRDDVVRISNAALRFTPEPALLERFHAKPAVDDKELERRNVWVLRNGAPVGVAVVPGISDGAFTELVSGEVQPGDLLIIDAPAASKEGPRLL